MPEGWVTNPKDSSQQGCHFSEDQPADYPPGQQEGWGLSKAFLCFPKPSWGSWPTSPFPVAS